MMSTTVQKPATTPIPVQLSEPEFEAFLLPHLSMPKRGPKCKLGYYRVFNLILWVLYTGMCVFHGKVATDSRRSLPLIPRQSCHPFHTKAATDSIGSLPPIPGESCR